MNALAKIEPSTIAGDAKAWATQINAQWRKSLEGVIATGRILLEAKASLRHGDFTAMLEADLDFNPRTAQRLMAIAQDARLSNPVNAERLPKAWGTLYGLSTLSDQEFDQALADDVINPKMERGDVDRIREQREQGAPAAHMASRVQAARDLDFSPTPPWATRTLIECVLPHLNPYWPFNSYSCSEPACGEGHMAEALREYFGSVCASDIHAGYGYADQVGDFLSPDLTTPRDHFDWIITNPPFEDRVIKFMKRALELAGVGVAMFVQLRYLEGIGRYEQIYSITPPTIVAPFVERVPLLMGRYDPEASTTTAFMWLVWIKGMKPQPPFWIPPGQRDALTRPDDAARFTQHPVARRKTQGGT